eukprot:403376970
MTSLNLDISPSQIQALNKNKKQNQQHKSNGNKQQKGGNSLSKQRDDWNSYDDTYAPEVTNFLDLSDINDYNYYEKNLDNSRVHYPSNPKINLRVVNNGQHVNNYNEDNVCSPILSDADQEENTNTNQKYGISISPVRIDHNNQLAGINQRAHSQLEGFKNHPLVKSKTSNSQILTKNQNYNSIMIREERAGDGRSQLSPIKYQQSRDKNQRGSPSKNNSKNKTYQDLEEEELILQNNLDQYEYFENNDEMLIIDSTTQYNYNQQRDAKAGSQDSHKGTQIVPDYQSAGNDKSFNIDYLNSTVITSQQKTNNNYGMESSKSTLSGFQIQNTDFQRPHKQLTTTTLSPNDMTQVMQSNPTFEDSPIKYSLNRNSNQLGVDDAKSNGSKQSSKRNKNNKVHDINRGGSRSRSKRAGNSKDNSRSSSPSRQNRTNNKKVMFRDQLKGSSLCDVKEIEKYKLKCSNGCCQPDPDEDSGKISCSCAIF